MSQIDQVKTYNAASNILANIDPVEKRYDSDSDRLFLVYYALPEGLNSNKWGVSKRSLRTNIKTAINKPVIIYRKNPNNRFHANQAGSYVHPTPEEAMAELSHPVTEQDYYKWQAKYAVGKVRNVEERVKGYAWTLEITDPNVKEIIKSDRFDGSTKGMPVWTSPQIITFPHSYPDEERTGIHDHWIISHVILTDQPAYGFDKSSMAAKCIGQEHECLAKTKSASVVGPKYKFGYLDPKLDEELKDIGKQLKRNLSQMNKMLGAAQQRRLRRLLI